jgi:RND family efflux transporter MFP subunit
MAGKRTLRLGPAGLAACILLTAGCGTPAPEPEPIRPVRVEPVFATGGSRVRTFAGSARAGLESRLSFKVAGTVQRLAVAVGDRVRAGQLLAELDPRDYELQVEDAEAALRQARARARNAGANLDRVRGLYENNNASRTEYDAARADYDSASAHVASLEKKLELARSRLDYTRLRAPLDGAIADLTVEVSENVQPGQTIATLTAGQQPEVEIAIPEAFIGRMREGQDVTVSFDALPGRTFAAVVTEVGVTSTGLATTYPVTVRLTDEASDVRPGMAAEVSIVFESEQGRSRILVPAFAVGEDRNGRFVFVATEGEGRYGVVRRREVQVGELTGEGLEIVAGLEEGELLVTAGVSRLRDGLEVRLPSATEPGS